MNYTEEERKSHKKFSQKLYRRRPDVKEKNKIYHRKYRDEHRENVQEINRRFYENHRSERIQYTKFYNRRSCRDPVLGDVVTYNTLVSRKRYHPDLYEGVVLKDCLIEVPRIKGLDLLEKPLEEVNQ